MTGDRNDVDALRRGLATLGALAPDDDGLLEAVVVGAARRRTRRRAGAVLTATAFFAVAAALAVALPPPRNEVPPVAPTPTPALEKFSGQTFDGGVVGMSAVSPADVFVAVDPTACAGQCPRLAVTHDGGWTFQALEADGLGDGVYSLVFVDTSTGWAMVSSDDQTPRRALRTEDGGRTWQAETLSEPQILVADGTAYAQGAAQGTSSDRIWRWNGSEWQQLATISEAIGPVTLAAGPRGLYAEYATAPGDAARVVRRVVGGDASAASPCAAPPDSMSGDESRLWILCPPAAGASDAAFSSTDGARWQETPAVEGFSTGGSIFAARDDWAVVSVDWGQSYVVTPTSVSQFPSEFNPGPESVAVLRGGPRSARISGLQLPDAAYGYLFTANGFLFGAQTTPEAERLSAPWPGHWQGFSGHEEDGALR